MAMTATNTASSSSPRTSRRELSSAGIAPESVALEEVASDISWVLLSVFTLVAAARNRPAVNH